MATRELLQAMAAAIVRTLESPEWAAEVPHPEQRAWTMMLAVCEALHPLGPVTIPSRDQVEQLVERIERDQEIYAHFDGRNYDELAARYRLTSRQVRRIVERQRRGAA